MKTFTAVAILAGAASAAYNGSVVVVTKTEFAIYCPEATTLTHGSQTITVTAPTSVTLSCPTGCAVTYPVYSSSSVSCSTTASAAPTSSPIVSAPYTNGTITQPVGPSSTGASVSSTTSAAPVPMGAGNKAMTASGAGLAAALGFAAFFL